MKNILILGGAGFVGSNLALYFNNLGHKVVVFDNLVRRGAENNLPIFKQVGIEFVHGDVRNAEDLNGITSMIDVVLDCAAQPSAMNYANPTFDITNNTYGVLNILEYCRKYGAALIFWSTNKVYTGSICNQIPLTLRDNSYYWPESATPFLGFTPEYGFNEELSMNGKDHSIYGVSKAMADLLVQEWASAFNIPSIINRFSCLAGPNQWGKAEQGWVAWFAIANKLKLPITIDGFGGNQVRDILFTNDLCELISKQINAVDGYRGEVFNVGGGIDNQISINNAITLIGENYDKFESIKVKDEPRRADQAIYISDARKVQSHFDWCPTTDIAQGYKEQIFPWVEANINKLRILYK